MYNATAIEFIETNHVPIIIIERLFDYTGFNNEQINVILINYGVNITFMRVNDLIFLKWKSLPIMKTNVIINFTHH